MLAQSQAQRNVGHAANTEHADCLIKVRDPTAPVFHAAVDLNQDSHSEGSVALGELSEVRNRYPFR